jgi:hypothetical protein
MSLAQTSSQAQSQVKLENTSKLRTMERLRSQSRRFNAHVEHVPSDETDLAISFINNGDFGWKADACKLQKHHPDYNLAQCGEGAAPVMLA